MTITSRIEKAFGADLTANPATWTWTDVSNYALGEVSVTAGRRDEASTTQPARCTFRLRNTDGRFSPRLPSSPYYPFVRRQTPVRVSLNPGTGYVQRFQGYVDEIIPVWPSGNSEYAEVTVTASGSLRRLGQGSSPLNSALRRAIQAGSPVEYWPLEDASGSTSGASALGHQPLLVTVSPVTFAGDTVSPPGGSLSLPNLSGGGELSCTSLATASVSGNAISFLMRTVAASSTPIRWLIGSGTYDRARVDIAPSSIIVSLFAGASAVTFLSSATDTTDGKYHFLRVILTQSGPNILGELWVDGAQVTTGSVAATLGAPSTVILNPQGSAFIGGNVNSVGHVAVFSGTGSNTPAAAVSGYAGETAGARIARLCTEQGVPSSVSSSTGTTPMGAQGAATFLSLVRECETTDGGVLYDGAGAGLNYVARQDRYNLPVAMALDTKQAQVKLPFTPAEDDQRIHNDWTVTRPGGSFARFTDPVHIAANGLYDTSGPVNVSADSLLLNHAAWRVHLGTVDEMRVPGVSLQLIDRPELWAAWVATTLGERITAANPPAQYPPGLLDMIVEGYTETWDTSSWTVDLNTSPYAPWNVDALGTTFRLELAGQTLGANLNPGANSLTLNTAAGYNLFTTTARFPADFPMDLKVGGWIIHVTAASGSSSPQTLTIDPSPNTATIPSGSTVSLWRPACLAL